MSASPGTEVKMFATALGGGILLDATLVRGVLAPGAVAILGRWHWWLPRRPARMLRGRAVARPPFRIVVGVEILTERLVLRPFRADDLPAFVAYRSAPKSRGIRAGTRRTRRRTPKSFSPRNSRPCSANPECGCG